jgi:hypothetical protein
MCLILDADIIHQIFPSPKSDYQPIYTAIMERRARIVYGGRLLDEYLQMNQFMRLLSKLDQQGGARKISDVDVDQEEEALLNANQCSSNDHHIIALSRISGARLLCTDDRRLTRDFTDPRLISNPRGNVYKRASHANLIQTKCRHLKPRMPGSRRKGR